jgi:hypothetical protein
MAAESELESQQDHPLTIHRLYELIDQLPASEWSTVERFLVRQNQLACDPLYRALHDAPYEDEPISPEEEAAVEETRQQMKRAQGIPWEEVRAELFADDETP